MPTDLAVINVAANTSTGFQTITSSAFAGTPEAAIIIACNATTSSVQDGAMGYGFLINDGNSRFEIARAIGWYSENGYSINSDCVRSSDDLAVILPGPGGTTLAEADLNGFVNQGIRLDWITAPSSAYQLIVILFGGEFEADVFSVSKSTMGSQLVGFQPDLLLTMHADSWADGADNVDIGFGCALRGSGSTVAKQHCIANYEADNVSPTQRAGKLYNSKVAASVDTSGERWSSEVTEMNASGFVLSGTGTGGTVIHYLALRHPYRNFEMGFGLSPDYDNGEVDYTDPGFRPDFLCFSGTKEDTLNTHRTNYRADQVSMGVAMEPNTEHQISYSALDNRTDPVTGAQKRDYFFNASEINNAALSAWLPNGFQLDWASSSFEDTYFLYWVTGPRPELMVPRQQQSVSRALRASASYEQEAIRNGLRPLARSGFLPANKKPPLPIYMKQQKYHRSRRHEVVERHSRTTDNPIRRFIPWFGEPHLCGMKYWRNPRHEVVARHSRTADYPIRRYIPWFGEPHLCGMKYWRNRRHEVVARHARQYYPFDMSRVMALFRFGVDALRIYGSGAVADDDPQTAEGSNLGGYRSSTEWPSLELYGRVPGLRILRISGAHTEGLAVVHSRGDGFYAYAAPESAALGPYYQVPEGQRIVLYDGEDTSKALLVERITGEANAALGQYTLKYLEIYNGGFGLDNVTDAERSAGDDEYRAFFLRNMSPQPVDVSIYLGEIATERVVDASGYAASGAVTITPTANVKAWPRVGFVKNMTTGETLYYTSRSSTALTVPSLGRDVMGTGAGAGVTGHVLRNISALRMATETVAGDGSIQMIADEDTAPTGLTWYSPAGSDASDVITDTIAVGGTLGLWVHRTVVAGMDGIALLRNHIVVDATFAGVLYRSNLRGRYRVAEDALAQYELYRGIDGSPDFDAAPFETFASLPHETAALAADTDHHFVLRYRNKYNLLSQNTGETIVSVDAAGDEQNRPSAPDASIAAAADGAALITAYYDYGQDATAIQADLFAVWVTYDGSTPDPSGAATTTAAVVKSDGIAKLSWTSPTQSHGTTIKAIVRTRRSGTPNVDSSSTDIMTLTADANGPSTPDGSPFLGESAKG